MELGRQPAARAAVRAAVDRLLRAGSGSVTTVSTFASARMADEGTYDIFTREWELERQITTDDSTVVVRIRNVGRKSWLHLTTAGSRSRAWPCWLANDGLTDPSTGVVAPQSGLAPSAVIAASNVVGRERSGDGYVGTTPLVTAAQLLSGRIVSSGAVDPHSRSTVPVDLQIDDGVLTGMSIRMLDLFTAFDAEGSGLPFDLEEQAAGLAALPPITVGFADIGDPVTVTPPRHDQVVSASDFGADAIAAMADCRGA